jgi:valyl-tRNA synthetase
MTKLWAKHDLEIVDILMKMLQIVFGLHYQGKDRFVVREEVAGEERVVL